MNKKVVPFCKIEIPVVLKKLQHINQLKNKLLSADLKSDYHLLKESWLSITTAGPTVASKKDQNNKELDIIWGNKSNGNNVPTKMLLEKSGLGKSNKPKNKPNNIESIAFFSLKFLL